MLVRLVSAIVLSLLMCPALQAQLPAVKPQAPRPAATNATERAANMRAKMLAKTGGIVTAPATGPALVLLDSRKGATAELTSKTAAELEQLLRLPVKALLRAGADPLAEAKALLADTNTTAAVVFLAELPGQPALLIAPENRWAQVNAAALAPAETALLEARLRKQFLRGTGYLLGAGHSNSEHCLMHTVGSTAELDALGQNYSLEALSRIMPTARSLGMQPIRKASYRKAVEEGWATAPTNDIQKAIWNEVRKAKP